MTLKTALITGITGQDGRYLAELLLGRGYDVHGVSRHPTHHHALSPLRDQAARAGRNFETHAADLCRSEDIFGLMTRIQPDEVYNLAAQTQVSLSFQAPVATFESNGLGVLRILEGIREAKLGTRLFQAGSAELFGAASESPQSESTPFRPQSPYATAKLFAHWIVRNYRESYGMHASNGILFNHESPMRTESFVTRKITATLARIRAGRAEILRLGHLDIRRDWGYAKDYVEAMWMMLQKPEAGDYVLATNETHSIREFVELAAGIAGFRLEWEGVGVEEVGRDKGSGKIIVAIDPAFYRPLDRESARGDAGKAARELGWAPGLRFTQLVELMMRADLESLAP